MFQFSTAVSHCGRSLILETTPMICCPCVCVMETTPFHVLQFGDCSRIVIRAGDYSKGVMLLGHVCLFMMSETAPRSRLHDVHVNALPPNPIRSGVTSSGDVRAQTNLL